MVNRAGFRGSAAGHGIHGLVRLHWFRAKGLPVAPITYSLVVSTLSLVGVTPETVGYWGYR